MKLIKLTGTLNNDSCNEDILLKMLDTGAYTAAIVSREIVIEVPKRRLTDVKEALRMFHVLDIKAREASIIESTVTHAADGQDPKKCVKVSMAPGTRLTGIKFLGMTFASGFKENSFTDTDILIGNSQKVIKSVLRKAGITDALISLEYKHPAEDLDLALELATINALLNTNGITQLM